MSDVDVFNWTSSYRWDSDIPRVSGYFIKYNSPESDDGVNYAEGKTKKVAWFVSNCKPHNNRTVYAKELAKYISVDIYGACGDLQCSRSNENECFKMLESDYKFYLSFENANCHHYVTEKFFGILRWVNNIMTLKYNFHINLGVLTAYFIQTQNQFL